MRRRASTQSMCAVLATTILFYVVAGCARMAPVESAEDRARPAYGERPPAPPPAAPAPETPARSAAPAAAVAPLRTAPSAPATPASAPAASLTIQPDPARALKETTFWVALQDPSGAPADGAEVIISLVMPAMDHGDNSFAARHAGGGVYVGKGVAVMAGRWEAHVTVKWRGRVTKATFPFIAAR